MNSVEQRPGRNALIAFRAENARSFRDELEFSMLATGKAEPDCVREVEWREGGKPLRLLPAAAIYGANASGKTNLLRIMLDMRQLVIHSFRRGNPGGPIPRSPFLLSSDDRTRPTRMEIEFILDGVQHKYGFVIDDHEVLEEWAYCFPKGRAKLIFGREKLEVQSGADERRQTRVAEASLRPNALLLSTGASTNHRSMSGIFQWFESNLRFAADETRVARQAFTADLLENEELRIAVMSMLNAADLGLVGARRKELDSDTRDFLRHVAQFLEGAGVAPEDGEEALASSFGVQFQHQAPGGSKIELDPIDESLGTQVWFGLIGPVLEAVRHGTVLLADELDSSLHPSLVALLVRIFQSKRLNPHHAQLIFNTHDSTLLGDSLGDRLLGRDQIWFTEKDNDGRTHVYSLLEESPRKYEAVGKRYLEGRYGATPIIVDPVADELALAV